MLKLLHKIWADIRRGENIDLYTTIAIATGLVILNLIGITSEKWIASITLTVLGLLAISNLGTRYRVEESVHQLTQHTEDVSRKLATPIERLLEKTIGPAGAFERKPTVLVEEYPLLPTESIRLTACVALLPQKIGFSSKMD